MRVTIEMDFRILLIVLYNYYFQFHACVNFNGFKYETGRDVRKTLCIVLKMLRFHLSTIVHWQLKDSLAKTVISIRIS